MKSADLSTSAALMEELRLVQCQNVLGYSFTDPGLLQEALTHSSAKSETRTSNERQEFLGDAILGMTISEHLYRRFPEYSEGDLTRIKSVVVSRRTLARVSNRLGLRRFIHVGRGFTERGELPSSLLANVFEAIVAAIYLDGGIRCAQEFILQHLAEEIDNVQHNRHERNYKSLLQQFSQHHLNATPAYRVIEESGPDHVKMFHVQTVIAGRPYGAGWGASKKQAEQRAAERTLAMLQGDDPAEDADKV